MVENLEPFKVVRKAKIEALKSTLPDKPDNDRTIVAETTHKRKCLKNNKHDDVQSYADKSGQLPDKFPDNPDGHGQLSIGVVRCPDVRRPIWS